MELPYNNPIRQTWVSVSGKSLPLPCFFPSISSVKVNLEPIEYLRMLVGINYPQFLISAFDIFYTPEDQRLTCPPKRSPVIMLVKQDNKGGTNGQEELHSGANYQQAKGSRDPHQSGYLHL